MVMRVGGLATGMDIEAIVNKLMEAERMPLNRMEQDRTLLTWERDAFREVNRALLGLDDMMLDMKLSKTYHSKTVLSSQENAVTATGSTNASDGSYSIAVSQLASGEMNIGKPIGNIDKQVNLKSDTIYFRTFDDEGKAQAHKIDIAAGDTVRDVLKKITNENNNVRAFYDEGSERVVLEMTRTGKYNPNDGPEIVFGKEGDDTSIQFFTNTLGLTSGNEAYDSENPDQGGIVSGKNAKFTYNNGLEITSKNNSYELNGIYYEFHDLTTGNATLTVRNDVEHSFDSIMAFVDKYNEVVEAMNDSQQEERFRDFPPLSDEQKKEMSDREIEQWEEKAQSGLLRGESAITNGMFTMRQGWYANVDTGGKYHSLTQIGITTSPDYMSGGKLIVDEYQLRQALNENPDDVQKLFSNSDDSDGRGLVYRLEDGVKSTMDQIRRRAGQGTDTLENYAIGKRLKGLNDQISSFEARMVQVETRYWNQFTQMETAIQRLNDQSAQLFSQFG